MIHVHIDGIDEDTKKQLRDIEAQLNTVLAQGRTIMAQNVELNTLIDQMNEATNEIAADLADLISGSNALDPADRARAETLLARLRALGASHEVPIPPVEPPPA